MRITKVDIPKESINNGLEPVQMHRLGQLVIIAGKNGSGKSRLLSLIKETIAKKPEHGEMLALNLQIDSHKRSIKEAQKRIKDIEEQINTLNSLMSEKKAELGKISSIISRKPKMLSQFSQQIQQELTSITKYENEILKSRLRMDWGLIETDVVAHRYTLVDFVPKNLDMQNIDRMEKAKIKTSAEGLNSIGVEQLHVGTYPRIQVIQNRYWEAAHQLSTVSEKEKTDAKDEYERLNELIEIFLNTKLGRDVNGDATIFGFPLSHDHLSDGQKILLQFCLAIHCQQKSLDEIILLMDEPENHLHPDVIIEIIERLREKTTRGQIWIATHSVPLIAYFNTESVWYMDRGKVSYAGNVPEVVLNGLLGDEDRISKLQDFISLPGVLALNRHAFESLFHPTAVVTDKGDPQPLQIRNEIKKHLKEGSKIKILDYGAGKGRLIANIIENNTEPNDTFREWFDYVAYDKFATDKDECCAVLQKLYPDWQNRYFNDFPSLFSKHDKHSFDVVVMCNVLHEIDPKDWLNMFREGGDIPELLNEGGILLVVEDHEMPIGEKAYQKGFIVLNTPDLKDLFSITADDTDFGFSDARENGRLKAHRIKREYLTRISAETRKKALKSIHKTAIEKIINIRTENATYKNGRIHGFWIQQLANTTLALNEVE